MKTLNMKPSKAKHKQSKYFTIMFVPSSSGNTRSMRIPHWFLYGLLSILVCMFASVIAFTAGINYLKRVADEKNKYLRQSQELNSKLVEESKNLNSTLIQERNDRELKIMYEKEKLSDLSERKIEGYEEKIKFYEEKSSEFEIKIEELSKIKTDLYNKLSKKTDIPDIKEKANALAGNKTPEVGMGGVSEALSLDEIYEYIEDRLNSELAYYKELSELVKKSQPYLENYPTVWPVRGVITSEMGRRPNPFGGDSSENHSGLDIGVPTGTKVKATGGGVVEFSGYKNGYGYMVIIDHGMGVKTYYAHNSKLLVNKGEKVTRGQVISLSGNSGRSTGPHVHYEVRVKEVIVNPRGFLTE